MKAFLLHLVLVAYVAPLLGCILAMTLCMSTWSLELVENMLEIAVVVSWLVLPFFVPVACCSFLFFRLAAMTYLRSLLFWVIAWGVIGFLSVEILLFLSQGELLFTLLSLAACIIGCSIAPLHHWMWRRFYGGHPSTPALADGALQ